MNKPTFPLGHSDGRDLFGKDAIRRRLLTARVAVHRVGVLLLARDALLLCGLLSTVALRMVKLNHVKACFHVNHQLNLLTYFYENIKHYIGYCNVRISLIFKLVFNVK